jgi:hypothetical protein
MFYNTSEELIAAYQEERLFQRFGLALENAPSPNVITCLTLLS